MYFIKTLKKRKNELENILDGDLVSVQNSKLIKFLIMDIKKSSEFLTKKEQIECINQVFGRKMNYPAYVGLINNLNKRSGEKKKKEYKIEESASCSEETKTKKDNVSIPKNTVDGTNSEILQPIALKGEMKEPNTNWS